MALEEFIAAMKAKRNCDIPFTDKSSNNDVGVLSKLLQPTVQATTNTVTCPRVSEGEAQRPRVVNNNNNNDIRPPRVDNNNNNNNNNVRSSRVLWPRATMHQQKHPRGTRV